MNLKRLRRRALWPFSAGALWLTARLCGILPRPWLLALARGAGALLWLVPGIRRLLRANLRVAFPDWSASRHDTVARNSLRHLVAHYLDFLWLQRQPRRLDELITMAPETLTLFQEARRAGQGVTMISPHLGCWELTGMAMSARLPHLAAVARRLHNPWINAQVAAARQLFGAQLIYEKGAVRGILAHLRSAGLLGLLVDQNTRLSDGGVFVPFFGVPATMSRAAAMFARKLQTRLVVGSALRQPDGRLSMILRELPVADYADDLSLCQAITQTTEAWVREAPEQYLWLYERWRYLPPGTTDASAFPYYAKPYRDRRAD